MNFEPEKIVDNVIKEAARALGKIGGSKKSEAKTAAARANGKKGGRPRKAKRTE